MMDISLLFLPGQTTGDIALSGADLATEFPLQTAVMMSLFTDRRAGEDDEPTESCRGGWWGDTFSRIEHDRIGSRLWLLRRSKETQDTVNLGRLYAEEALQWLLDDNIAEAVNVDAFIVRRGVLGLHIHITQPTGVQEMHYQYVWN
jgi:phage gp46-like protein